MLRLTQTLAALAVCTVTLSACAYVEREARPSPQAAVVVPQAQPLVVTQPAPSVVVRPAF